MSTTETAQAPRIERRTMRPRGRAPFDRLFLFCPSGHEVGSVVVGSRWGDAWEAGDFTDWPCGYGACSWEVVASGD